ncbi:MAG TPA: hypothetical protein VHV08_06620, partial [Pirellulales bacterium]|nr:hypothetical protein [Pirellulales bacterium]
MAHRLPNGRKQRVRRAVESPSNQPTGVHLLTRLPGTAAGGVALQCSMTCRKTMKVKMLGTLN